MDKQTGLDILGLAPSATLTDARAAFRRLAKTWHPDRFVKDPVKVKIADEKMKQLNAAFHFLLPLLPDKDVGAPPSESTHGRAPTHGKTTRFQGFFSGLATGLKKLRQERKKTKVQASDRFGPRQTHRTHRRAQTAVRTRKTAFEDIFQNAVNQNQTGIHHRFHSKIRPSRCYTDYKKYFDSVAGRPRNLGHMKNRGVGPVEKISPISPVSSVKRR